MNPRDNSNIFHTYYDNLKTKEDCNDIVGDFKHYKPATPVNKQLCILLARDKILSPLVVELLTLWVETKIDYKEPV